MFEQLGPVWQNFSVPDPDLEIRGVGAVIQILRKGGGGGQSPKKLGPLLDLPLILHSMQFL